MLAGIEVETLNAALRLRDHAGNKFARRQFVLNRKPGHHTLHPVSAEYPKEVVIERKEKLCRTRIALPARAAAELVVSAPGLVALSADNMQTAEFADLLRLFWN